jgi:hypothetical protein
MLKTSMDLVSELPFFQDAKILILALVFTLVAMTHIPHSKISWIRSLNLTMV